MRRTRAIDFMSLDISTRDLNRARNALQNMPLDPSTHQQSPPATASPSNNKSNRRELVKTMYNHLRVEQGGQYESHKTMGRLRDMMNSFLLTIKEKVSLT
jgi:hypothetical protein